MLLAQELPPLQARPQSSQARSHHHHPQPGREEKVEDQDDGGGDETDEEAGGDSSKGVYKVEPEGPRITTEASDQDQEPWDYTAYSAQGIRKRLVADALV